MATSTVARVMTILFMPLLLVGFGMLASAQSIEPSNQTLTSSESNAFNTLRLSGELFAAKSYYLAPLTINMGKGMGAVAVGAFATNGYLKPIDYASAGNLTINDIAYINCDPDGSNIDTSTVVDIAGDAKPAAIILHSLEAESCNLTGPYNYTALFSITSRQDSEDIQNLLVTYSQNGQQSSPLAARIGVNNGTATSGSPPSTQSQDTTSGGQAPTTAVAMSILYSITGIITLLFLVIIATGAIRAHRHPERYGPRNGVLGRPRQSRAKGLTRAMLETLPMVKFGDPEPVKQGVVEIELEDGRAKSGAPGKTVTGPAVASTATNNERNLKSSSEADSVPVESGMGAAQAESVKSGEAAAPNEGELGCSICTEDFTTGEDVRVLPCHHKYHPACIDPWLLNVSGTCPLCRHDLRPVTSATSNTEETGNADGELPPPLPLDDGADTVGGGAHQHRRVSRLLDLSRLRHAPPDERIAALRQLRVETRQAGDATQETEEPSRRARLTSRLRDTFRIRTRAQAEPSS